MSSAYCLKLSWGLTALKFFNKSFKEHKICTQTHAQTHTIPLTLHKLVELSLNSFGNLYKLICEMEKVE